MPVEHPENKKKINEARRLCELFRGRFSEEVARRLIDEFGGELEAVDFVLNEKEGVVAEYLKQIPSHVASMRSDSKKIATLLENGIEYDIRQFACEDCVKSWWKKVPTRKQVSKCKSCQVKYDPVPQDKEWGWAKFVCACTNVFHAYGEMGVTKSTCYKCNIPVPVTEVLPPRRRIGKVRKSRNPHSCNGANCFNHDDAFDSATIAMAAGNSSSYKSNHASHHNNINYDIQVVGDTKKGKKGPGKEQAQVASGGSQDNDQPKTPVCIHPKSNNSGRRIRTPSKKHRSTGSTVDTFMTQGSVDTATVSVAFTLESIHEADY